MQRLILVIDDEPEIRYALSDALAGPATRVTAVRTAREGLALAAAEHPDAIVLDLGLPDGQGLEVCREIRRWSTAPIIVLSARDTEPDKVTLLNAGADDYVTKPFALGEFVARVHAQIRRARTPHQILPVVEIDGLRVDLPQRSASRDGSLIRLTPIEWGILQTLVMAGGRPVTHQQIFDAVWDRVFGSPKQYLRVYVTHLRRKIERNPSVPRVVITEPGVGYRLGSVDA